MTTYNKSKIMKEAHYWRRVLGLTMSEALKMSWRNAKTKVRKETEARAKSEAYKVMKQNEANNTRVSDMSYLADSLTNYYNRGNGAYFGD